ncbi:type VI secretion system baseplate subunit TssG [Endozoicomonas gorgoniicola]|uniref:Type VI secretion system baseplate subunit TssG n=1 Tax=Endozoicomonas gorgoniicola TaxID=1234144 RepID=A0ABT3MP39_9GAMM|nr:type VI secretion system baseplate subunit TssG [Endozoicomonas gorgoniicola]MCW7551135.1 type VI secretion system baseplate subunit TssG [Endozoicomonas gorgoniicola]
MYTPTWLSDQSLSDSLQQQPWRWQFAQAVRIIELTGGTFRAVSDPVYGYASAEISDILRTRKGWRLKVTCPSLNGYNGVLPYVYQDLEQQQRLVRDDDDLYALFSVFNHRALKLTSMVANRSSLSVRYEERYQRGGLLDKTVLTLLGTPIPTQWIPPDNLVRYTQVLHRATTSLVLLSGILQDYFSIAIRLEAPPLVRLPLAPECLTRLRCRVDHKTKCVGHLSRNAVVGRSCYLLHTRLNVVILARNPDEYAEITSDRSLGPAMLEMCTLYFAGAARFRLQIECSKRCLASPTLNTRPCVSTARLGLLSCLIPERHPDQTIVVDYPGLPDREPSERQDKSFIPEIPL